MRGNVHFLSSGAAAHLRALRGEFDLVWCTGWEERANEQLLGPLGLTEPLPWLRFGRRPGAGHAHWKLDAIEACAGTRPLAWIDDAHDDACRAWAAARTAPTLLVTTTPSRGLLDAHAMRLHSWAAGLAE